MCTIMKKIIADSESEIVDMQLQAYSNKDFKIQPNFLSRIERTQM